MHLGCCAYSYRQYLTRGEMDLFAFLDTCAEIGCDGVELTAYYFPNTERETLFAIKRAALKRGLDIAGTAVGNNFCQADPARRAEQIQMVKDWIDHSVLLGAPLVRVFAGGVPAGHSEEEARAWTIAALQECADYGAERGIMLALENHGGITATAEQVEALLKGVSSDWLGLNLDTGNFRQDPYGSIRRTAPHAINCHLKSEVPAPGGKEPADIRRIIADLEAAGYRGYLSIEFEADEDPKTGVPRFAREILDVLGR